MSQLVRYTICNDHYLAIGGEMDEQRKTLNGQVGFRSGIGKGTAISIEIPYEKK